jgi:hypothetical protein
MADLRATARRAAQKYGLDPDVFLRQINQESGFNPTARSPAGALGVAQIMPATARGWGVDPLNPTQALDAAAKNMRRYVDQYGSYKNALVAYNAGPGRVGGPLPAETQNYIKIILGGHGEPSTRPSRSSSGSGGGDNSAARAQLIQSFLEDKNADPVQFALQGRALQDVAPTSSTKTRTTGGARTASVGSHGQPDLHGSAVKELIYNDGGKGFGIKNGAEVDGPSFYSGVWAGHANHVHVAAGPKTVVELGRIAQHQFGLHVGENPHFGGVNPVHVPGSYHNKGEAIDVSGDKAKMRRFAEFVKHYQQGR